MIYVFIFIVLLIPVFVMQKLGSGIRRGCGRGCATCGNREFCHRTGKYAKESSPSDTKQDADTL